VVLDIPATSATNRWLVHEAHRADGKSDVFPFLMADTALTLLACLAGSRGNYRRAVRRTNATLATAALGVRLLDVMGPIHRAR
jgi:hypothetical protein